MAENRLNRYWALAAVLLIAVTLTGGVVAWSKYLPSAPVEITMPAEQDWHGTIHIGGAVANPGFYPFGSGDSLDSLIRAAGGATDNASSTGLTLHVKGAGQEEGPQRVDINRAEVWLLRALPGVGETLAQRIVDYREQNGPFLNTGDLVKVAGIGASSYERIKDLITVAGE